MSMDGLICKNLYKSYKKTEVLKGLDLTLEKGKIYGTKCFRWTKHHQKQEQ